jgi:hypothetical protein
MSKDTDRIAELNTKVVSYGSQTATDSQALRDRAHARDGRQRGSACCQTQEFPTGKFHG